MSVQNSALWLLIVVCVDSLWTGYSETWILCSLNPHFPCDSPLFFISHAKISIRTVLNLQLKLTLYFLPIASDMC